MKRERINAVAENRNETPKQALLATMSSLPGLCDRLKKLTVTPPQAVHIRLDNDIPDAAGDAVDKVDVGQGVFDDLVALG